MTQILKAIYSNGTFVLQTACDLPEGIEVELIIQSPKVIPPPIADLETKKQLLKALVERMQQNPIPLDAPRFTRDMLHKRQSHDSVA
ncbi:MAG: antitoxin family protein [Oculatellaceae cyanobacterium Prado106]|jgi:predicted DNA-binding antitoxin AbrB/MazE fold protein|nr:antitoxin family protein [Oculatellaceae cyanobacterium Prado106]